MRLANKTALITGGNSGIGLATARLFVAEGARVAITGRNQATLEAAAKELGPNALAIVADATDIAATEKAVKQAVEKFGKLDIVFANAGIAGNTPIGGTTLAAFESVIRTNITAVFFTVQAAAPYLNDGASIVLNGSVISVLGNPGYAAYAASKGGLDTLTRSVAVDHAKQHIRCNTVSPGYILNERRDAELDDEGRRRLEAMHLTRLGQASDVAYAVLYLASREAEFVTGIMLPVDGGSSTARARTLG